jgi:hypothetical protein
MTSHSYYRQGIPPLVTRIRILVTYPRFGNDSNSLRFCGIARISKTKTISKTRRVPVIAISHPPYKNPSTLLKHSSTYT